MTARPIQWPPPHCKWCDWPRKFSMAHRSDCPSYGSGHGANVPATEILPGLFVGDVETRPDPRWSAVVTILTQGEAHFYKTIPLPSCDLVYIDHEDRKPGLLEKCPTAWQEIDRHLGIGPVLIHCGAGASRSPTVAMGWLISRRGYTTKEAIGLLVEKRPQVMHLWPGFVRELEAFADEQRHATNGESRG